MIGIGIASEKYSDEEYFERQEGKGKIVFEPRFFRNKRRKEKSRLIRDFSGIKGWT